jgi:glucose/arabinose dehydrogenase
MQGVAIDPNFAENRRIYVYSTSSMTAPGTNRVMRLVVNEDFTAVSDRTDIVEDIPYKPEASDQPFGGPARITAVASASGPRASSGSPRVTPTAERCRKAPRCWAARCCASIPTATRIPTTARRRASTSRIYTYGHRNVQGIAFNPATGAASSPSTGRGIPTRSPFWSTAAMAAGTRRRTPPAGATARRTIAAMSRCSSRAWTATSAAPTCR